MRKTEIEQIRIKSESGSKTLLDMFLHIDGTLNRKGDFRENKDDTMVIGMSDGSEFKQLVENLDEKLLQGEPLNEYNFPNGTGLPWHYEIAFIGEKPKIKVFKFTVNSESTEDNTPFPYFYDFAVQAAGLTDRWYFNGRVTNEEKEFFISAYGDFAKVLETNDPSKYYEYLRKVYPSRLEEIKKYELERDGVFEDLVKLDPLLKNLDENSREELKKEKKLVWWKQQVLSLKDAHGYNYFTRELLRSSGVIWRKSKDIITVESLPHEEYGSLEMGVRTINVIKVNNAWYYDKIPFDYSKKESFTL